jgi:hypothetical protein
MRHEPINKTMVQQDVADDKAARNAIHFAPFVKRVGKLTLSHDTLPSIMGYLKSLKHLKPHTVLVK